MVVGSFWCWLQDCRRWTIANETHKTLEEILKNILDEKIIYSEIKRSQISFGKAESDHLLPCIKASIKIDTRRKPLIKPITCGNNGVFLATP